MKFRVLLVAALLAGVPDPGRGAQPPAPAPAPDAALEGALTEIDAKSAAIKDLSARFEQTKKTALLRRPLVSSGTVKVVGGKVRWDTEKPHRTAMVIDEAEIRMYYPDQGTLEIFDVDRTMRRITASPLPRLALIREQFHIARAEARDLGSEGPAERYLAVSLSPRDEALRKHLERVRVLIDRASGWAVKVEITDADGDVTTIGFSDLRTNTGIAESDLTLQVPTGTRVVRPLEGLGPGHVPPGGGT